VSPVHKLQKTLTNILLAFALISFGFMLGKHSQPPGAVESEKQSLIDEQVVVYYLHATFRCVTCNTIEEMTKALLKKSYSKEMTEGRLVWKEVNFQQDEALARQFEVSASCVVVAHLKNNTVTSYRRLDEVWTWMADPEVFNKNISDVIESYLEHLEVKL
jgi:hypothetical protein